MSGRQRFLSLVGAIATVLAMLLAPVRGGGVASARPAAPAAANSGAARSFRGCVRDTAADFRWTASLYATFLHRSGTFAEVGGWTPAFVDGTPYQQIAYEIADSDEAVRLLIPQLYQQLLHRTPSASEVTYWVPFTKAHSTTGLASQLAGSAEAYSDAGGTDDGWLRQEYQNILGYPADPDGLSYWTSKLAGGTPRSAVAGALWNAPEHLATRVDAAYQQVLGRHADAGGATYWAEAARTFGDTAFASLLASTQEAWSAAQVHFGGSASPIPPVCPPGPIRWIPAPGTVVHTLTPLAADGRRLVALTFDDGPNPTWTPQVLAILDRYNIPATFFLVGYEVKEYPDLVRAEVAHGNHVAVHTLTHPNLLTLSYADQYHQIVDDANLIDSIAGPGSVKCFRPPGGNYNSQIVNIAGRRGLATILWSRDGRDWALPGVDFIVSHNLDTTYDGGRGIIDLHDSGGHDRTQTIAALPILIQDLQAQGYQFVFLC